MLLTVIMVIFSRSTASLSRKSMHCTRKISKRCDV